MLVNSAQILPSLPNDEESAFLRSKIEELNKNTVRLITQAEKLVEESKQLSERIKSFEIRCSKPKHIPPKHF
jgi:uncharacterized coiled-coil DUF342 family protein